MEAKAFPMLTPREIKLITALIVDGDLNVGNMWSNNLAHALVPSLLLPPTQPRCLAPKAIG